MGNSNSIGQFTPTDIDLRQRAHWQYLSQQQQQQQQRASFQPTDITNTSIKVLPELNDTSGHLRSTDNGVILFNGGTISGRRDTGAGVVRSKSISSPQQEYMRGLQRHKTQLEMPVARQQQQQMGGGLRRDVDGKLFGSEPDLRGSPADAHNGRNSRKFKGQPKVLATSLQQQQQQRDYDSSRFGWRPRSHQPQGHVSIHHQQQQQQQQKQERMEPPKKPRLFKTREETKKVSSKANQSKLATEASDVQSKKPSPGRQVNEKRETERKRDDSTTDRVIKVIGNRAAVPERLLPKAEVLSKPVFRREKSFDISLLLSRGAQKGTSLFPNVFRKSSTTEKNAPIIQADKRVPLPPGPGDDKTMKTRRSSQPPPRMTDRDFQKELQEATRRRSMMVPLKEDKNAGNKSPVVHKSAIVTQSPVLKAMSKPRPSPAKENARPPPSVKCKAPKPPPPQSSKVEGNKVQLEVPAATKPVAAVIELQQQAKMTATDGPVDAFPGGEVSDKPVTSFYYGMPEKECRTGNAVVAAPPSNKVNGFHYENGQVGDDVAAEQAAEKDVDEKVELTAIESFAESIFAMKDKQQQLQPQRDSSESAVSSFVENPASNALLYPSSNSHNHPSARCFDDTESLEGISLQLRPTLPKKQFEIPRFSPAAAWRLLTTAETARDVTSQLRDQLMEWNSKEEQMDVVSLVSGEEDEEEGNEKSQETESRGGEEQIERIYREPVPGLADNKSGDSGISGDGGLLELGDSSPTNNLLVNDLRKLGPFLQPWTPQQDLEDDSSSDPDEQPQHNNLNGRLQDLRAIEDVAQKHVFSLSLPRDSHSTANLSDKGATTTTTSVVGDKHFFSSLQKTKLGHCYLEGRLSQQAAAMSGTTTATATTTVSGNDNWFLGRSQPNSIEKNHPMPSLSDNEDVVSLPKIPAEQQPAIQPPSFNYLAGGCHFMYLPNRPTSMSLLTSSSTGASRERRDHHLGGSASLLTSKTINSITALNQGNDRVSAEKVINGNLSMKDTRESLQDAVEGEQEEEATKTVWNVPMVRVGGRKGRRFTFQSTVRQIERRKIADKLSREAEEREAQRLSELEAMQKVEQEFQMKRAREKASIRQQLRLFSLEANQQQQQHYQGNQCEADYSPSSIRREPDGAAESMGNMNKLSGGCHTLQSTSLLLELNGGTGLTRDYSKFPYREFLK